MAVGFTAGVIALSIGSWCSARENKVDIKNQTIIWSKLDPRYHAERLEKKSTKSWTYPLGKQPYPTPAEDAE